MSIIKDKYIFIHIPKTAGTSIEQLIGGSGHRGIEQILTQGQDDFGNKVVNPNLPVVCFVRNPFDRLVSAYHFVKQVNYAQLPPSFPEFVNNINFWMQSHVEHFSPQWKFVSRGKKMIADYVFRFENLIADFEQMKILFDIKGELPHVQTSDHRDYKEYYTPKLAEKVRNAYHKDFTWFNYPQSI